MVFMSQAITGWGAHSVGGVGLIKQAVLDFLHTHTKFKHFVEPGNDGVVCVVVPPANPSIR